MRGQAIKSDVGSCKKEFATAKLKRSEQSRGESRKTRTEKLVARLFPLPEHCFCPKDVGPVFFCELFMRRNIANCLFSIFNEILA